MAKDTNSVSLLDSLQADIEDNTLSLGEVELIVSQTLSRVSPVVQFKPNVPYLICDPLFVFRGDHRYKHHDALGYKNRKITQRQKVIVLGNSQVHSLDCPPAETWPAIFNDLTNVATYNGSMGSFSIVQNFLSARELLPLCPDLIICVYYTSNNTVNSLPTLRKSKHGLQKMFSSFDADVSRTFTNPDIDPLVSLNRDARIMEFMKKAKLEKDHFVTASINNIIHFTIPAIRYGPQDLLDPYVEVAFSVAKEAISKLKKLAQTYTKFGLFVLVMPTKEFVLYDRFISCGDVAFSSEKQIYTLYQKESMVIDSLKLHCEDNNIPIIDPLNCLVNSMHLPIYNFLDVDGHPSLQGKRLLAGYVKEYMSNYELQNKLITKW